MLSDSALAFPIRANTWQHDSRFFVLAAVLHLVVLIVPFARLLGRVDLPPPGPLTVQLLATADIPHDAPPPPKPLSVAQASPPQHRHSAPLPKPRVIPILAMNAEQQPPTAGTPTVAVAPATVVEAAPPASSNVAAPAPAAISAARFDAAYLQNPKPTYPPLSRRLGEEGKVLLKVRVTAEGLPAAIELERSSNFERLDAAAREVVTRWRFIPAKRGEQPVEASVIVPIVFHLEG